MSHSLNDLNLNRFDSKFVLAEKLADDVCRALKKGIARNGSAVLAVSGGSTPKTFFKALSSRQIDWERVTVTLVDERWVGEDSDRSNARLVKENLLVNQASSARFMPLYHGNMSEEKAFDLLEQEVAKLPKPFDAIILGMGTDGHTASFFPGGDNLPLALDLTGKRMLSFMRADGAGELRITFTLPVFIEAGFLALHIEGEEKMRVLDEAASEDGEARPVHHVLKAAKQLEIYWCD